MKKQKEIREDKNENKSENVTKSENENKSGDNKPKEIVSITNDIDETSSLANFFQDMKEIVETKGIKVEDNKNFVLFEDASEVETK